MTTRAIIVALLVARAVVVSRTPVSRAVMVSRPTVVRAFVTSVTAPVAAPPSHLLTESGNIVTTELGDELITES